VPPGWAHCVINADPFRRMTFGALCDREYGFDYRGVRAHRGLAWFALLTEDNATGFGQHSSLRWVPNSNYQVSGLVIKTPSSYTALGLDRSVSIYGHFIDDPDSVQWISEPQRMASQWHNFVP
jgi:glucose-6-phosphate isomerase, archaeal